MKQMMTTLLLAAAMAGASCTGSAQNGNGGNATDGDTTAVTTKGTTQGTTQTAAQTARTAVPEDSICDNPDVRPRYDAKDPVVFLLQFLNKNLRYPEEAAKRGLEGTVVVQMVVERDGTPTHFGVVRDVDPLLDAEALRVARLLPRFVPAEKDGKPVRCTFNFSIPYRLK